MTPYERKALDVLPLPVRRRVEWHLARAVPFIVALECSKGPGCPHGPAQGALFDRQVSLFT